MEISNVPTAGFREHVDCPERAHRGVDIAGVHVKGRALRLQVPGWYGMASVKWLDRVEVMAEPFQGNQMAKAYRHSRPSDELGAAVTLISV